MPANDRVEAVPLPLWKKILFSSVLLLAAAVVFEVGASVYLRATRGYDGEHLLQYEFDPYKNIHLARGFVDTRGVTHNAAGFRRSDEVSVEKPKGTYRIFLMGGSAAYGTGGLWPHLQREFAVLDNDDTIDAFLERQLSERFPGTRFEVINAAIPSIWTHHHLIYLNQTILRYDPDMVLFLDGFNDFFFYDEGHEQFSRYAYGEHATVIMGSPTLGSLVYTNVWWLARKSAFAHVALRAVRNLRTVLAGSGDRVPIDPPRAMEALQEVFPRNALAMIERTALILENEGVEGVFMLQPMLVLENHRRLEPIEKDLYEFNVQSYLPGWDRFMVQAVPWVAEAERLAVEQLGGHFLDLTDTYRDHSGGQIFTDYVHLTPLGNEILARRVTDFVAPLVETAPPSAVAQAAGPPGD